jgi:hypothetical protein
LHVPIVRGGGRDANRQRFHSPSKRTAAVRV